MKTTPLFDEPAKAKRQLSKLYAAAMYRASKTERPRWTQVKLVRPIPCDECFAMQIETKGECGPRADAKQRRAFLGGPVLALCRAHALLWRERDVKDGVPE